MLSRASARQRAHLPTHLAYTCSAMHAHMAAWHMYHHHHHRHPKACRHTAAGPPHTWFYHHIDSAIVVPLRIDCVWHRRGWVGRREHWSLASSTTRRPPITPLHYIWPDHMWWRVGVERANGPHNAGGCGPLVPRRLFKSHAPPPLPARPVCAPHIHTPPHVIRPDSSQGGDGWGPRG